jgi:hypothetical protein
MSGKQVDYTGSIIQVRDIEDAIRASKKYTEILDTMRNQHPIQGGDFPSKVLNKAYEVYPNVKVEWDMPALKAWASLVFAETYMLGVRFRYDYRDNRAEVRFMDGPESVEELKRKIPLFSEALEKLAEKQELKRLMRETGKQIHEAR